MVVEAQETINSEHWPVYQEATGGLRTEEDVDDRHSQVTPDGRNEEKHESTGSGFVANALAAGVGTLLASGIANYGSYGSPYTSGKYVEVVTLTVTTVNSNTLATDFPKEYLMILE